MTGTIRFRITALSSAAVLGVLVVAGAGLVTSQRRLLTANLDGILTEQAEAIATLVVGGAVPATLTSLGDDDTIGQVVTADGRVLASTANIEGEGPVAGPLPPGETSSRRAVSGLPHDPARFRLLSRRVAGPDAGVVIHVAGNLDDIEDSAGVLRRSLLVAVPALSGLLAALIWWLVGRTLRPVEAIRVEVAGIGGKGLHRRVPVPPGDDEIARLARTMNTMLERVEDSSGRQARFVADASHELRSPLTRIRAELEVDLAHPARADLAATHRSVLAETETLSSLVDDLLALARGDTDSKPPTAVDLDDLVFGLARRVRPGSHLALDLSAVSAAQTMGHAEQLARAVGNVAENALRHARTRVAFTLAERDGMAILTVTDDGPGIPAPDRERVFERFTRLDDSRTAATGGAGLGLAIARDIVGRHGGTIAIDPDHTAGARFVLRLPIAPAS